MIRINLLPVRELKEEFNRRRELTIAGVSLAMTCFFLAGIYLYQSSQLSRLNSELPNLRKEVEVLNGKLKQIANLENRIKELKSKHLVIEELSNRKVGPVRLLDSLAAAIPPTLWLLELKQNAGHLIINGLATDNQSVAEFIRSLSQTENFKDVELIESLQADEKIGPYKRFSIQSVVSYGAPKIATGVPLSGQLAREKGSNR